MRRETIRRFMTVAPVVVKRTRTLADAHRIMRERNIRHLPVVDRGTLVGVVSQRDLYLVETLMGVDPTAETVVEAMSGEPFTVGPEAPLDAVAAEMAKHKYGSAVVVDRGAIVGLFTTTDALRALAILSRRGRRARATPADAPQDA